MEAYGVPADDPDGLLPWSWAQERLVAARNYWLTTVDPGGRPHSMPVWGIWDADSERFWFSCDPGSFKARNLADNPWVVVAPEDTVDVVSLEGTASLYGPNEAIAVQVGTKYESDPDKQAELTGFFTETPMYEVVPVKAFGVIERPDDFGRRATRWMW